MFSNIFQKTALFGASTVAGVALTGTMMANPVEAATMSYNSEFSITSNRLNGDIVTGDFSFTKTELPLGKFSYKLISFDAYAMNQSLSLNDIKANPDPFLALNQILIKDDKYQTILPSILAGDDSNYVGDGDFPPDDFTKEFSGQDFTDIANKLTPLISAFLPSFNNEQAINLANFAFSQGGEVNFKTTSVPEPNTIFSLAVLGVGLTRIRRRSRGKRVKIKITT